MENEADPPDRTELVIERIERFTLTTAEDVRRSIMPEVSLNGVQKVLARLVDAGWLAAYPLVGRKLYFVPGPLAVKERGLSARKSGALGPQALVTAYAILEFCEQAGVRKITAGEFSAQFPELSAPQLPASTYFVQPGVKPRLGHVLVDHGAEARRIAAKVRRHIRRRIELPAFADLIRSGSFIVAVVTPSAGKASQLRRAIGKRSAQTVEVMIEPVDELLQFFGPEV